MTRDELAESYGMTRFRCPRCHRSNYADGAPECPCGWTAAREEKETKQQEGAECHLKRSNT